jgi:serine/threonine protein kinase
MAMLDSAPHCRAALQISDFDIIGRVGDGSFSTVILARLRGGGEALFAIKIVNKHLIVRNKMADYVRNERTILDILSADECVVKLLFTFQDADSLCEWWRWRQRQPNTHPATHTLRALILWPRHALARFDPMLHTQTLVVSTAQAVIFTSRSTR